MPHNTQITGINTKIMKRVLQQHAQIRGIKGATAEQIKSAVNQHLVYMVHHVKCDDRYIEYTRPNCTRDDTPCPAVYYIKFEGINAWFCAECGEIFFGDEAEKRVQESKRWYEINCPNHNQVSD